MQIKKEFKEYLIEENVSLIDSLERINAVLGTTLLVHKDNYLVGTLMDSDVRRFIMKNKSVDGNVGQACRREPRYVTEITAAQEMLTAFDLNVVPVVDENMSILSVAIRDFEVDNTLEYDHLSLPVVMMAGGKGTRLYPYTRILPKALIPVGEIPIAEQILKHFGRYGCNDFYMILNHKKEMIKAYFSENEKRYDIHFIDEDKPLGTGGGLALLKGKIKETFILTNCDILIYSDMNQIYNFHKEHGNLITMICSLKNLEIPYGVVEVNNEGEILSFEEKPQIPFFTNTGCYFVEPSVIEELDAEKTIGFPEIVMKYKQQGKNVGVYPVPEEQWFDMGQPDELERMREKLL